MLSLIPLPYRLLAIALFVAGTFAFGYMKGSAQADIKLAKAELEFEKLASAKKDKSIVTTTKTVIEYVDKVREVEKKIYVYRDKIKEVIKDSGSCPVPLPAIVMLNDAISEANGIPTTTRTLDASPSPTPASQ